MPPSPTTRSSRGLPTTARFSAACFCARPACRAAAFLRLWTSPTNRLAWRRQLDARCYGGSVATAGGLVFLGRNDGRLTALDSGSGRRLWSFQLDAGVNAPPTSFEFAGEQYIAVLAGGSVYGGRRGDGLWLFSLHGSIDEAEAPAVPQHARVAPIAVPAGRAPDLANGRSLFATTCAPCHGDRGQGGHGGGVALTSRLDEQQILEVLNAGRSAMPAFGGTLSLGDMQDVASFVLRTLESRER